MQQSKRESLTYPIPPLKRKVPVRGLAVAGALSFFGMVTAYGIAPETSTTSIQTQTIAQEIRLPQASAQTETPQTYHLQEKVLSGESLGSLLDRLGVSEQDIQRLQSHPAGQIGRTLRAGQHIQAKINDRGELLELQTAGNDSINRVVREADGFTLDQTAEALETRVVMRSGKIQSSLFAAMDAANVPDSVAEKMAEIFGTQLDFRDDLRKGDTFSIAYQINMRNGEPIGIGKILAAEFINAGKPYRAVLYRSPTGEETYYTPDGESLKKGFLRSPLEFSRVTSGFSNSRKHPVYGFHRKHTGVDFGAPTGTRVKATGDGIVSFAGYKGGYGNLIILRHHNGFETYYAHLSGFATGIRKGSPAEQGNIIGYVGSTGASTGPHLHYEVRIAGIPQNPITVKLPGSPPLPMAQKVRFMQQSTAWNQRLDQLRGTNLAALD